MPAMLRMLAEQWSVLRVRLGLFLAVTVVFSAAMYFLFGFSRDDVKRVQESIRSEYRAQKGIVLTKVDFVRKGPNELQGTTVYKVGQKEVVKSCIASRENRSADFVWVCR